MTTKDDDPTRAAINLLIETMFDELAPRAARVAAAGHLLNAGLGSQLPEPTTKPDTASPPLLSGEVPAVTLH